MMKPIMRPWAFAFQRSLQQLAIGCAALACVFSVPAAAQDQEVDIERQLLESAELARFLTQMDELCEMTDEIVFAQSVLLLAESYGWDIWSSDFAGSGPAFYLFNVLEETELPSIHLMRDVRRNSSIDEDDRARAESLYIDYTSVRTVAQLVHKLVSGNKANDAAAVYLDRTIPMRRAMRADCFTVAYGPYNRIVRLADGARLDR